MFSSVLEDGLIFHTVNDDKPGNRTETMAEARSAADDRDDEEVDEMNTDFQLHFWCRWVWNMCRKHCLTHASHGVLHPIDGDFWMARIFRCWVAKFFLGDCHWVWTPSRWWWKEHQRGRGTRDGGSRRDVFRDLPVPRRSYFLMLVDVPALVTQISKLWWP